MDRPRMSPDSVVVEIAVLELPQCADIEAETFWQGVDEQQLSFALRKRLSHHGLRCGVIGSLVPGWIRQELQQQCKHLKLDEEGGTATPDDIAVQRRLQCRSGKQRCIPVARVCEQLVLENPEGSLGEQQPYVDCQCSLGITAFPLGDGRVKLELAPEVQYGKPRQRWVGQGGLFQAELSQDSVKFEELSIDYTLTPGQTLVLAASPVSGRLGQAFCDGGTPESGPGKLILLRLAQTQLDDLFDPRQALTPIATLPQ